MDTITDDVTDPDDGELFKGDAIGFVDPDIRAEVRGIATQLASSEDFRGDHSSEQLQRFFDLRAAGMGVLLEQRPGGPVPAVAPFDLAIAMIVSFVVGYLALWQLTTRAGWESVWDYRELFWKGWRGTILIASGAAAGLIGQEAMAAVGAAARAGPDRLDG